MVRQLRMATWFATERGQGANESHCHTYTSFVTLLLLLELFFDCDSSELDDLVNILEASKKLFCFRGF